MNPVSDIIKKKLVIEIPVWLLLLMPLLFYPVWEYYWYTRVGLSFIKWHTHLAVYAYLWLAGAGIYLLRYNKNQSEKAKNILLLFSSVIFCLTFVELYFHISGSNKTQTEKDLGIYRSPYISVDKARYHIWPTTSKEHWIEKPEFRFWRPTNSMGLPDVEWPKEKPSGQIRILALGDSFTEGDGAAFDSTYVAFLKQKLNATGYPVYFMNGGVCGSDPFNNYVLLKDRLLSYKPDIIIQVMETNDINTDIILRGGMERFQKNGLSVYHTAPWWEPIYALSYISRMFFDMAGYNELLLKSQIPLQQQKELNDKVTGLFKQYSVLCNESHIRLCVVLLPCKNELESGNYSYNFTDIITRLKTDDRITVLDLLPAYTGYIAKNHTAAGQYYWVEDGHHNAKGYKMMADCIYDNVAPVIDSAISQR